MKTTEQKNRMIAEFMGLQPLASDPNNFFFYPSLNNYIYKKAMQYHTSWDWLMPVVEEIESLGFNVEKNFQPIDKDFQCLITKGNDILFQEFNEYSITAMHYVVVEFIEFYNKKTS